MLLLTHSNEQASRTPAHMGPSLSSAQRRECATFSVAATEAFGISCIVDAVGGTKAKASVVTPAQAQL